MEPNLRHNPTDSRKFRREDDLYLSNANLFIANNNNPFLISPYSPPPNYVRQSAINELSSVIATFIGDISTVINLTTFTLSISTIEPISSGDTVTISSQYLNLNETVQIDINAPITNISGTSLNVSAPSYFNYISANTTDISIANISSLSVSSINVSNETVNNMTVNSTLYASTVSTGNITFDTMTGNTITADTITANSTLYASTVSTGNITFDTMAGNTITADIITANSTLYASTVSTGNITFDTMTGNTITADTITANSTIITSTLTATERITTNEFVFSSLCMIPSTISTLGTPTSSILICLNGSWWKIPIEKA